MQPHIHLRWHLSDPSAIHSLLHPPSVLLQAPHPLSEAMVNVLKFNTFLFLLSNTSFVTRAGSRKNPCQNANREDANQTASSEAVWFGSALFVQAFLVGN